MLSQKNDWLEAERQKQNRCQHFSTKSREDSRTHPAPTGYTRLLSVQYSDRSVKVTTHIHPVLSPKTVELYCHAACNLLCCSAYGEILAYGFLS
jgi:hypothetical protein